MLGYKDQVDTSLYAKENRTKFLIFFKKEGKIKKKRLDFSKKDWDKKTRVRKAKEERDKFKDAPIDITFDISLDDYSIKQFELLPNTSWTKTKISHYNSCHSRDWYCFTLRHQNLA